MAKNQDQNKYSLPIKEIKKDLIKTSLFSLFSVLVLILCYYYLPGSPIEGYVDKLLK